MKVELTPQETANKRRSTVGVETSQTASVPWSHVRVLDSPKWTNANRRVQSPPIFAEVTGFQQKEQITLLYVHNGAKIIVQLNSLVALHVKIL